MLKREVDQGGNDEEPFDVEPVEEDLEAAQLSLLEVCGEL
jgi:hypothetical protein